MNHNGLVNMPPAGFKASLRSRVIVAAILVAIFVPAFVLGGWVCFFVFMAFLSLALIEVLLAPQKRYGWWVWVFTFIVTFCYVYWFVLKSNLIGYRKDPENYAFSLENYFSTLDISVIGIAVSLIGYFVISIFDKNFEFSDVSYLFTMTILLGMGFQAFYFVRYFPFFVYGFSSGFRDYTGLIVHGVTGPAVLQEAGFRFWGSITLEVYVFIGVIANDVFAYFGGVYFGKHKMNPRISPKKTWEGFWFGAVISFLLSAAWGLASFALAAILGVIVGSIKVKGFSLTTTGGCILVALVFGHFGRVGKISIMPEQSVLRTLRELGLMMFLIGAGVTGGAKFVQYFEPVYFLYGAVLTLVPMIIGFVFAKYVLKMPLLNNLGSITGGMTSTPALGTLISVAGTEDVAAAYAATYPIALISVVIASKLIIMFC